ncbi:zn-cys zinc finger domain protein [Ceraceosorus bombacis]|uniref:Transcription activator of gluconeogenesis ERT1 n=1 Tax=Ceraceosorus bombacis TaxID=401625 RepID=A0A0P1BC15_9BASI|nr:zn-cys zinc finger domain protein [Ceraceosorus bombacis]
MGPEEHPSHGSKSQRSPEALSRSGHSDLERAPRAPSLVAQSNTREVGFERHSGVVGFPYLPWGETGRSHVGLAHSRHSYLAPASEIGKLPRPPPLPPLGDNRPEQRQLPSLPGLSLPRIGQGERDPISNPRLGQHGVGAGSHSYDSSPTLSSTSDAGPSAARMYSLPPSALPRDGTLERNVPAQSHRPRASTQVHHGTPNARPSEPLHHTYDDDQRRRAGTEAEWHGMPRYGRPLGPRSHDASSSSSLANAGSSTEVQPPPRRVAKANVASACMNCRRAHLACDAQRPCQRCKNLGKTETCIDVQHKQRGRPRLRDREVAAAAAKLPGAPLYPPLPSATQEPPGTLPTKRGPFPTRAAEPSSSSAFGTGPGGEPWQTSYDSSTGIATSRSPPSQPRSRTATHAGENEGSAILICSTELRAARASDEALALLGIHKSYVDFQQISLLDLVHSDDVGILQNLSRSLIEPVQIPLLPAPSKEALLSAFPSKLIEPASGTIFLEGTVRIRLSDRQFRPCVVRLYLGGGLGANLYLPDTFRSAYIVAGITPT